MSALFQQTLTGLVKALRANKRDEQKVINAALEEIRLEVKASDWDVKGAAILKLIYLEMLGHHHILAYSFNVLECMACPKFHIKQVGYLAAAQSFGASTEVILLANNLIKKDLQLSSHPSTVILALTSLPSLLVASPQLAEDIFNDLVRMLSSHSRPTVRRIATLTIGKIWCSHNGGGGGSGGGDVNGSDNSALPIEFSHVEKLRAGLADQDSSVVSATVNVMLELARTRTDSLQSLLSLAPELFDLLTNSSNNWMLIKIAKLFALLTPIEPRLVRKLLPPLTNLISTTPAFSLLYECIQTVITGGMLSESDASSPLAQSCIEKLSSFLSDHDQNLRYIALKGLSRLVVNAPHTTPLLAVHYDEILACIDEEDLTIRLKALELVEKLTDRSNCRDIVGRLIEQISPSSSHSSSAGSNKKRVTQPGTRSAAGALRAISSSYDTASPSGLANDVSTEPSAALSTFAVSNYRYRLLLLILRLTSRSSEDGSQLYVNITNFEWYIDTLIKVAYLSLSVTPTIAATDAQRLASKLSDCLLDVTARATPIRDFAVKRCKRVMADDGFLSSDNVVSTTTVSACSFIIGEYGPPSEGKDAAEVMLERYTTAPSSDILLGAMQSMTKWLDYTIETWSESESSKIRQALQSFSNALARLSGQEAFLHCALVNLVLSGFDGPRLPASTKRNQNIEEDEQAAETPATNGEYSEDPSHNPFASSSSAPREEPSSKAPSQESGGEEKGAPVSLTLLRGVFAPYELRPLAPNAQSLVTPPPGVNLDAWIGGTPPGQSERPKRGRRNAAANSGGLDVDEYGRPRASTSAAAAGASMAMSLSTSNDRLDSVSGTMGKKGKKSKKISAELEADGTGAKKKKSKKTKPREKDGKMLLDLEGDDDDDDVDAIPIVKLDLGGGRKNGFGGKGKGREPDHGRDTVRRARTPSPPPLVLSAGGDMPSVVRQGKGTTGSDAKATDKSSKSDSATKGATRLSQVDITSQGQEGEDTSAVMVVEDKAAVKVVKKKKKKKAQLKEEGGPPVDV